jgi:hypothetical protein
LHKRADPVGDFGTRQSFGAIIAAVRLVRMENAEF